MISYEIVDTFVSLIYLQNLINVICLSVITIHHGLGYEFRLREPLQFEICRDIQLNKRHTPWSGMLLMDARTCIQMEKKL